MEQILRKMNIDFFGQGKHKIMPEKLFEMADVFFLDVRSKDEVNAMSIKLECFTNIECSNIPVNEIPDRLSEIPKDKKIAVFCPANVRSTMTYTYLLVKGFPSVRIVEGGYTALTDAIKPGKIFKKIQSNK